MWRDARDALLDMQQACREVIAFSTGIDPDRIGDDVLRLRAIERSLGILGEAAKRVPVDVKTRWPDVPWRALAGLRDVLVHDYFGIDLQLLAQVIRDELPTLDRQLMDIIAAEGWDAQ